MKRNLRLVIVFVFITVFLISCNQSGNGQAQKKESVYDRVIRTGKIKCGYVVYPPGSIKDPNTGKLYGICIETLEKAGENLSLKVEWTEEVGWGSMIEGLKADRYDIIGSPVWANTTRGKLVDFSNALFYSGIGVYVRRDDTRFGGNIKDDGGLVVINNENIKIATIDGEMSDIIARSQFPKAKRFSLPQLSDVSLILLNVAQKKADVTFAEPFFGYKFLKNNPRTIKNVAIKKPIRIFPNTWMFKQDEIRFKTMINIALMELINSGFVDELIDKYEGFKGALYRVNYPYRMAAQ